MKRILVIAAATLAAAGCTSLGSDKNPYENPFYAKYLNTGSAADTQISRTVEQLRQNPDSAELHNNLGALLVDKGFPNDAEREFERAVDANGKYFPAWYNLGLVRAAQGDDLGARHAFNRTVDLKPGHAAALFQLGLVEEKRHHTDRAVHLYAKAFTINPALMEVKVNPRVLDSKLTHLALLEMYPTLYSRRTMQFQTTGIPAAPAQPGAVPTAPSPQAAGQNIVTPAAPVTDPAVQATPAPAAQPPLPASSRRRRPPAATPAQPVNPTPPPATPPS
jgi:tetratricopeptide (TPR) repeat protein